MNTFNTIVILSAEIFGAKDNEQRTEAMRNKLNSNGYSFKEITGVYKDNHEKSFLVVLSSPDEIEAMHRLGNMFNQECVLVSDANRRSYLKYANGTTRELGRLQEISKDTAKSLESYSVNNGKYYAAI